MPLVGDAARIRAIRERLLERLLIVIAVAGVLAYVPSAYLSIRENLWVIFALDTFACISAICLAFFKRLPFGLKVGYLVGLSYALGVLLLLYTGQFGAGHLFLFAFVFLAALFGGVKAIIAANAAAVLTHVGFFIAATTNLLSWPQTSGSVLVISANSVLISLVLSVSANYLLRGYAAVASEEERHRQTMETMLKELEHRVKNNLQVISSLINLRARSAADPRKALQDIQESVSAVSVIHQLLYRQSAVDTLDVKLLLDSLVDLFRNMFHDLSIAFQWNGPGFEIGAGRAVSLGLLINEIVANSAKYAFGEPGGAVSVRADVEADEGSMLLSIGDSGRGMRPDAVEGIGMQIIRTLARQIDAELDVEFHPGVRYRVRMQSASGTSWDAKAVDGRGRAKVRVGKIGEN